LVVFGNGMAGMRTIEELLKMSPDEFEITVFGAKLYARFLESQKYSQDDPWKERTEGKDAHEYQPLATIA
jgi:NAD(P)H-nitrite reductase large subunit